MEVITVGITEDGELLTRAESIEKQIRLKYKATIPSIGKDNIDSFKPYIVGRMSIKSNSDQKSIAENITMDYMGCSEFEWVYPLISRIKMWYYLTNNGYRVSKIDSIKDPKGNHLYLFHHFTDNDLEIYINHLLGYLKGENRFIKWVNFDDVVAGRDRLNGKFDCWWDLDNSCFWSFNADTIKNMPNMAKNTINKLIKKG